MINYKDKWGVIRTSEQARTFFEHLEKEQLDFQQQSRGGADQKVLSVTENEQGSNQENEVLRGETVLISATGNQVVVETE